MDAPLVRAAQMMGTGRWVLFFQGLLPAVQPTIASGLRIGLETGWRVLPAAEMVVDTGTGPGYSIIQARWSLDYAAAFAASEPSPSVAGEKGTTQLLPLGGQGTPYPLPMLARRYFPEQNTKQMQRFCSGAEQGTGLCGGTP